METPPGRMASSWRRGEIPKGVLPNVPVQFMPRLNFAWDIEARVTWSFAPARDCFTIASRATTTITLSGQLPNHL